jgi:hypothetical protein
MLWSGEWAWGSRAQGGLERRGESPEGAPGPRARWSVARGGVSPSNEAENRLRGIAAGCLVGRYGFNEPWAFPNWATTIWGVFSRIRGAFICAYYFS